MFKDAVAAGGKVRGLNVKGAAEKFSRKQPGRADGAASSSSRRKGLAWVKVEADKLDRRRSRSSCRPPCQQALRERLQAAAGRPAAVRRRQGRRRLPGARATCGTHLAATLEARRSGEAGLQDRLGARFPVVHLGRGGETLGGQPSSVHGPDATRTCDKLETRPGQGAGQGVRPGHQRLRGRRRQHPYPQPGGAVAAVQACWA